MALVPCHALHPFCHCCSHTLLGMGFFSCRPHISSHMLATVNLGGWNHSYHIFCFVCTGVLANGLFSAPLSLILLHQSFFSLMLSNTVVCVLWASTHLAHASICLSVTILVSLMAMSSCIISISMLLSLRPWINCSFTCLSISL